jgi:putative transposase
MKTSIIKAFTYKLKPSRLVRQVFNQYAGSVRYIYNYMLALLKSHLETENKWLSYKHMANLLPVLKRQENTLWLKRVHSQVLQQALKNLENSITKYIRSRKNKQKAGFPRFKKKGVKDSFRYPQGIKITHNKIYLPKIGWIRYINTRPLEGKIKQATIKRERNAWLIHISCVITQDIIQAPLSEHKAIGIDVGLLSFAYLSDGTVIDNPRFLRRELKQLYYLQRSFARKKKGSKNRAKLATKIGRLHTKIKNKRKDFAHKLSTALVKNHDIIAVEDLQIQNMIKNKRLARAIADVGWGLFLQYLEYKCLWQGKHFVRVNTFLPSSKLCSTCGNIQAMSLNLRVYKCSSCSIEIDRDLNASKNIRAAGISVLKEPVERRALAHALKQESPA